MNINLLINRLAVWVANKLFSPVQPPQLTETEKAPVNDSTDRSEEEAAEALADMVQKALERGGAVQRGPIKPLKYYMYKYFEGEGDITRSEIIENLQLVLKDLGDEIMEKADGTEVTTRVEREQAGEGILLHGHLDWKVDTVSPVVYDISISLLRDGFVYRTDTKTFVVTTKIVK